MKKKYPYDSIPEQERTDASPEAKQIGQEIVNKFEEEKALGKTVKDIIQDNILNEEKNAIEMHNRSTHNSTKLRMYGSEEHNTVMVEFADKQGNVADEIVSSNTPPEVTERDAYYESMKPLTDAIPSPNAFDNNSSVDSAIGGSPSDQYHSPSLNEGSEGSDDQMDDESSHNSGSINTSGSVQENNYNAMIINNPNTPDNQKKSSDSTDSVESQVEEASSSRKRKRDDDSDEGNTSSGPSKRVNTEDYLMDAGSDIFDLSGE